MTVSKKNIFIFLLFIYFLEISWSLFIE